MSKQVDLKGSDFAANSTALLDVQDTAANDPDGISSKPEQQEKVPQADKVSSGLAASNLNKSPQGRSNQKRSHSAVPSGTAKRFPAMHAEDDGGNRQAELFYLQKQVQLQTPMVFILEDGARIQGIVEWYDRHSIKVRGKSRVLVYKSAIKYLYKAGEIGSASDK